MGLYNRNALQIDTEIWAPFNPLTGAASNIDNIIAKVGAENVVYVGGALYVAGAQVAQGDHVGIGDDLSVGKYSPGQIATEFTEE